MKRKLLIACAFVGMGSFINAQTTMVKNDNGQVVTPEAGDWALGMNAAPILDYVGNMFNGTAGNTIGNNSFINGTSIYGKYFVDENTAFRGTFGVGAASQKFTTNYGGANGDSLSNTLKASGFPISLSFGMEKRKGHGRLQGYYGGELMVGIDGTAKRTYEYAVAFDSASFNNGTLVDFNGTPITNNRLNESKGATNFMVGVRGFVGVEYFVAPKFSIGAEYGLGLSFTTTSERTSNISRFDSAGAVETVDVVTAAKGSRLGFATDNFAGAIRFMYHF